MWNFSERALAVKANYLLRVLLLLFLLVGLRLWYLTVVKHQELSLAAYRPSKREQVLPANRGLIYDRFGKPLAINGVKYNVALTYKDIAQIPRLLWRSLPNGRRVKSFARREYVERLSQYLGQELEVGASEIEDQIFSKAALVPDQSIILKEDIPEALYYRLKAREHKWVGLCAQQGCRRVYPEGKNGASLLGYLGPISEYEYQRLLDQLASLEAQLAIEDDECERALLEERQRLLRERSYRLSDIVGKTGVEKSYEPHLRGHFGKRGLEVDAKGRFMRQIPGSLQEPEPGKPLVLSISSELQAFAEKLLIQSEARRDKIGEQLGQNFPLIKGGAIVAMDPNTGQIVALASTPRYDPNDFTAKKEEVMQWLETPGYLAQLWDGEKQLEREELKGNSRKQKVTWSYLLHQLSQKERSLWVPMGRIANLQNAARLQLAFSNLLKYTKVDAWTLINTLYFKSPHQVYGQKELGEERQQIEMLLSQLEASLPIEAYRKELDLYLADVPSNFDKMLLLDLCQAAVDPSRIKEGLFSVVGGISLDAFHEHQQSFTLFKKRLKREVEKQFVAKQFVQWRKENQQAFLKAARKEEKLQKKVPKPYLEHLEKEKKRQFEELWQAHFEDFLLFALAHKPLPLDFASYQDDLGLHFESQGSPLKEAKDQLYQLLKDLGERYFCDYVKAFRSFDERTRALFASYPWIAKDSEGQQIEKSLLSCFYPRGGFAYLRPYSYRQSSAPGSVFKLLVAHEGLRQRYRSGHSKLSPFQMHDQVTKEGSRIFLGTLSNGQTLTQNFKGGLLPRSQRKNIGQIDLSEAIVQSSNPYFSLLAAEHFQNPAEDFMTALQKFSYGKQTGIDLPNETSGFLPDDLAVNKTGIYHTAIGQHKLTATPLQVAVMLSAIGNGGKVLAPTVNAQATFDDLVVNEVEMSASIRQYLLGAMHKVIYAPQGGAYEANIRSMTPQVQDIFRKLRGQFVGKTGSAEVLELLSLTPPKADKCTHIWFGGISFDPASSQSWEKPELVVVVYLRYGDFGKEAAPLAAQVVEKWREIKRKRA